MAGILIVDQIQNSSNTGQLTFDNSGNFTTGNLICSGTITGGTGLLNIGSGQIYKDTSGNVGIGTPSPNTKLDVSGASGFVGTFRSSTDAAIGIRLFRNGVDVGEIGSGDALFSGGSGSTFGVTTASATPLLFGTNSSERMRLDSSGNLGLGVTPSGWGSIFKALQGGAGSLWSYSTSGFGFTANAYNNSGWKYVNNGYANSFETDTGKFIWYNAPSGTAGNAISFTQAMTLDANGRLVVGATSPPNLATFSSVAGTNQHGATITAQTQSYASLELVNTSGISGATFQVFRLVAGAANLGVISANGTTNVTYGTSSDARLKKNIVNAPSLLSAIDNISVRSFDWISDGSHTEYGFIAQELKKFAPECVSVSQDDEMMSVDYGRLTPRLLKAIQELSAQNKTLEERLAKLENK